MSAVKDAWPLIAIIAIVLAFFGASAAGIIDPEAPLGDGWSRVAGTQPIYHRCSDDGIGTYRNSRTRGETIVPDDPRCER